MREKEMIRRRLRADEGAGGVRRAGDQIVESRDENPSPLEAHFCDVVDQELATAPRVDALQLAQIDTTRMLTVAHHCELARTTIEHVEKLTKHTEVRGIIDRI